MIGCHEVLEIIRFCVMRVKHHKILEKILHVNLCNSDLETYTVLFSSPQKLPDSNVVSSITGFFSGGESDPPQVSTHWFSESGIIDLFVMLGPRPLDVFRQYGALTGFTNLPPVSLFYLSLYNHTFFVYFLKGVCIHWVSLEPKVKRISKFCRYNNL